MKKIWLVLSVTLVMLAQSACAAPAAPGAAGVSADPCPAPTADLKLLTNEQDGYCFLYPAAYSNDMPNFIVISPAAGPGDVPGEAWVNFNVAPANNRTAAQAADESIAAFGPGFNITKTDVTIDGAAGVVVDGLPGQDSNRQVLIVHNDKLFTLTFAPWYPTADGSTSLENLYTTIIGSLRFPPAF